jgi:hypothetical protein
MPPDDARMVRQALWMPVIGRTQQQRRRVDGATGDDDDIG